MFNLDTGWFWKHVFGRLLFSVVPGALLLVAAACMFWYKLGRRQVAAIQGDLDARRHA